MPVWPPFRVTNSSLIDFNFPGSYASFHVLQIKIEGSFCSVLGGLLTVAGFYLVVWGQGLERRRKRGVLAQILEPQHDVYKVDIRRLSQDLKEPLLSK